jgi:hypothetical protein
MAAIGAKRPFVEYAIYVVHGTKQRRPIVRLVIGGAQAIAREPPKEAATLPPFWQRCSHRIATISA